MSEFIEVSGDTVEDAIEAALSSLAAREDEVEIRVVSEGSGRGGAKVLARIRDERSVEDLAPDLNDHEVAAGEEIDPDLAEAQADAAHDFVEGLLEAMGIDGAGLAVLIGRHGATLASVQELTRAAVQKDVEGRAVVHVDIEGYMARRQESLERIAQNMAAKVKRTKRPVDLQPMPARDRKIIHDTLSRVGGVKTGSEGQEPFRYVVISPA